ncbi:hypothetical protein BDN72DRAFT_841650 [Pluteus cervinus]|uniref:Uncharacterized protein n=1 Tax=Pluteus cervinus TaxID=181527 RepID=A0ACD3ATB0_9AGAR|nr:hypothetical protein BDN72DRAFT_841650 [Pluteus cervinus]
MFYSQTEALRVLMSPRLLMLWRSSEQSPARWLGPGTQAHLNKLLLFVQRPRGAAFCVQRHTSARP